MEQREKGGGRKCCTGIKNGQQLTGARGKTGGGRRVKKRARRGVMANSNIFRGMDLQLARRVGGFLKRTSGMYKEEEGRKKNRQREEWN